MTDTPSTRNGASSADPSASHEGPTVDEGGGASAEEAIELEPMLDGPPPVPPARPKIAEPSPGKRVEPLNVTSNLPPRAWPPKTVADLMSRKVITLVENEPIGDLEGWMKRFRFRHLPVVDASMKLVGLITLTDLLHATLGIGRDGKPIEKVHAKTPASEIMRKNVVTGHPDAPATTACRVMIQERFGCLPIILDDNTLVGIVTQTDFTRLALEMLERS
jgi:CBS domain-containing protein